MATNESSNTTESHYFFDDVVLCSSLRITLTKFKKPKLFHEGYYCTIARDYRTYKDSNVIKPNAVIEWKCVNTGSKTPGKEKARCPGRCKSFGMFYPLIQLRQHEPDPEHEECLLAYNESKRLAEETNDIPRTIISKVNLNVDSVAAVQLIRPHNMRQIINRVRKQNVERVNFVFREEIDIPDELKKTIKSELLFLWDESGKTDPLRVIIFSTTINIDKLDECQEWYVDGTFEVSPLLFKQVITVNVIFNGKNLPLIYSLLPNKSEASYREFFEMLLNNTDKSISPPTRFIIDFEIAVIITIRKLFINSLINGCYFHYCQSLWRNVQKKGLITVISKSKTFRVSYRQLQCLAFVNLQDVVFTFNLIKENAPKEMDIFIIYFEK